MATPTGAWCCAYGAKIEASHGALISVLDRGAFHCAVSLRETNHASTSDASQTVQFSPSLKGRGNVPSLTKRQIVAGETGKKP